MRPLLGTYVEIGVRCSTANNAIDRAFAAIAKVERLMSRYDPASDVSRLNRAPKGRWIAVHSWTWAVLTRARRLSETTGGVFDVTRGSDGAAANWRAVELRAKGRARRREDVQVDLGGIAKGFAIDVAIETLRRATASSGVVNAGGDLRVFGKPSQHVHVRDPARPNRFVKVAEIHSGAAATSGNYFDLDGVGRLRTPRGRSLYSRNGSITVIARTATMADALTKYVAIVGPHAARSILDRYSAQAAIIMQPGLNSHRPCIETSHPLRQSNAT